VQKIAIIGRYAHNGIDLAGEAEALRTLAQLIERPVVGRERALALEVPATSPQPYRAFIESLRIVTGSGKVCISHAGQELTIAGSPAGLGTLAHNILSLVEHREPPRSNHLHVEPYPGCPYLAEESAAVVITRRDEGTRCRDEKP
jgi:hemin uptake protein HemP